MEPTSGPIRWGVAGTGAIAAKFVTDFANLDDGEPAEVVAVASRDGARAKTFADAHAIDRAHDGYDDLATDPGVDIVYVAGIHPVHAPHTEMFLAAGKHVLVEKPIALNVGEVDRMIAAAEAEDRFLMEAMWMRFNPIHTEVMRRLTDGEIGAVRRVVADFSFAAPFDPEHRLFDRAKGGGALLDLGIYPLTLAWWTLGPPDHIAHAGHVGETGVDDEISLLCSWDDGRSATLTAGLRLPGTMTARIEGTAGAVELPFPAHAAETAIIRRGLETEEIRGVPAGLHHQVVEVHRCLRAGANESPLMPWATSRAVIGRFDEIRAAMGVRYDVD